MFIHCITSIVIACILSTFVSPPQSSYVHVQVLSVNDLHGQLNITGELHRHKAGRADYLAAYLRERKRTNPNTLIVHTGDMVGGSPPVSALFQDEPTIETLNKMNFDIGILGNHEFDKGIDEMYRLLNGGYHEKTGYFAGASFPYICANAIDLATGDLLLPPYIIKHINDIPIGFIGVVTKDTPYLTSPQNVTSVMFLDEVQTINHYVQELKQQGVHSIIILAHNPGKTTGPITTGEVPQIAEAIDDEVDVIVGAHNHSYMNDTVDGKLLVEAYSYGLAFADIDLVIDPITKDIIKKGADIIPTFHKNMIPDVHIQHLIQNYENQTAAVTETVIGTIDEDITRKKHSNGESKLGRLLADAQRTAMNSTISFVNSGSIRGNLFAGTVTWGTLFTIQPFGNTLVKMNMSGKDIRKVLNEQWKTGLNILQVSGLRYTWDSSKPYYDRIQSLSLEDGTPIEDEMLYSITVNSFLANGGDHFSTFLKGSERIEGMTDLEAIVQYIPLLTSGGSSLESDRIKQIN